MRFYAYRVNSENFSTRKKSLVWNVIAINKLQKLNIKKTQTHPEPKI